MASASIVIPLSQLPGVLAEIAKEHSPTDLKPCLRSMGVYLSAQAKRCFDEQRSPDGVPWKPLAMPRNRPRDKRAARSGRGTGQKALRDRGFLMAAASASASSPGGVYDLAETYLEQGVKLEYAAYHQYGVNHPIRPTRKKALFWAGAAHPVKQTSGIPARPFLGITDRDGDKLALIAGDYYVNGGKAA